MGAVDIRELRTTEHRPSIVRTRQGLRGRRYWRVGDADPAIADSLTPALGEPWSAEFPALLVAQKESELERAKGVSGPAVPGACIVKVDYAPPPTPSQGGQLPLEDRQPGKAYTAYDIGEATVQVRSDLENRVIAGGQGAPMAVWTLDLIVTVFAAAPPSIPTMLALRGVQGGQVVNANPIVFPPMYRSALTYAFQPGELRFRSWKTLRYDDEASAFEIEYRFAAAQDHRYRWAPVAADATALPTPIASTIYEAKAFPQLWPTP